MSSILPLPPAIAHSLPWRMTFRTKRPCAPLEQFADKAFVTSLTPDEVKHCEAVISTLLAKMLATHKIPRTLGRWHVNLATSQKIWEERSPPGLKVSLGNTRYTVADAADWIGDSVNRLLKALRPDPGTRQPEYQAHFADSDWEDVGHHGAAPTAVGGPKPRKASTKPAPELDLTPPANMAQRRKRHSDRLKLLSKSGRTIHGHDYRLGWLLFETHKVVHLNRHEPAQADEVIGKLARSSVQGAAELGRLLESHLEEVELLGVAQEIRGVLKELFANAGSPGPWTVESLHWAFGVSENGRFDPHFWSAGAPVESFRLRKKLYPVSDAFLTTSLYSPALLELADQLVSISFIGSRRLQARLGPLLGDANVIGVAKFMTDVVGVKWGRMDTIPVAARETSKSDLFFWNQDITPSTVLEICQRARDLTIARGAFSAQEVLDAIEEHFDWSLSEALCLEILNEWTAVRWLDQPGYGVVIGASPIPALVEQLLAVASPQSIEIAHVVEAIRAAKALPSDMLAARKSLGVHGLVDNEVLLAALSVSGKIRRVGRSSIALKKKPETDYWLWRPVERDLVDFLKSVGGEALNREIYRHFKEDKSVDPAALGDAMKVLPYLYAPTPLSTAVWEWAIPKQPATESE